MKGIPQGRYTREFRQEAVKLVVEDKLGDIGKAQKPLSEVEMELARTKKELVEVKMERDILKKAAAYFAKESLPGTRR